MVNHHFSPPSFGRIFLELFPSIEQANPRTWHLFWISFEIYKSTLPKFDIVPQKLPWPIGKSSSNHHFSGPMFNFGGVIFCFYSKGSNVWAGRLGNLRLKTRLVKLVVVSQFLDLHPENCRRFPFWLLFFSDGLKPPPGWVGVVCLWKCVKFLVSCYHMVFFHAKGQESEQKKSSWTTFAFFLGRF